MASRRRARQSALQILYELDSTRHDPDAVLSRLLYEESVDDESFEFISSLVKGVLTHFRDLDSVLARYAPAFPVDQMATIDRNILRIALYELMYTDDTPVKVCINEAVELSKEFGADATRKLVNGVLGAVASKEIDSGDESAQPTDESAQPTDESTQPTDESTQPTDESTRPTDESTQPTDESTRPTDQPTQSPESQA